MRKTEALWPLIFLIYNLFGKITTFILRDIIKG
jgi:hypothetical protein